MVVFVVGRNSGTPPISQPTPTPIPYLDMESYTNSEALYKIDRPAEWKMLNKIPKRDLNKDLDVVITSTVHDIYNLDQLYPDPFIAVYSKEIESEQDYNDWISMFGSFMDAEFSEIAKYGVKVTLVEGRAVLGITWGEWYLKYYIFKSPDNKYAITIMTTDTPEVENQETFDQILSTFQFTN